jgi:hypothetical protein
MSKEKALAIQREMTPAIWQMISGIVEATSRGQMEKVVTAQKMLFCYENDLPLNLAVNGGLYVVKNRLEVEGNVIRAQLRRHPEYDYRIDKLDNTGCTMTITRSGTDVGTVSFNQDDAKLAGLLKGKENWEKYPADMYLNRATSRAYKRFAPDIFYNAVYVRGEMNEQDDPFIVDADGEIMPTIQELIDLYGNDAVLEAMQKAGDEIGNIVTYLESNHEIQTIGNDSQN